MLVQEWLKLEKRQKDLDYEVSDWAARAVREHATDEAFIEWCAQEFGMKVSRAGELLLRAKAHELVSDRESWNKLGGMRQIRSVVTRLTPAKAAMAVTEAKASGRSLSAIVREVVPKPALKAPDVSLTSEEFESLRAFVNSRSSVPAKILAIFTSRSRHRAA